MSELAIFNHQISMTSLEIADLTGKRHDNVLRDIEGQLSTVCNLPKFGEIRKDLRNREQKMYRLPRREVLILLSGYSVELRAKIIDRLEVLEKRLMADIAKASQAELLAEANDHLKTILVLNSELSELKSRPKWSPITESEKVRIRELRQEGASWAAIARQTGRSVSGAKAACGRA